MSWFSDAREAWQQHREDKRSWGSTQSLADLGKQNNRWLDGEVRKTPGHMGPPDPESDRIKGDLKHLNERGFVTSNSEPGWKEYGQHAQVSGNTDPGTAGKVEKASREAGLEYRGHKVAELPHGWNPRRDRTAPTRGDHNLKWGGYALGEGAHRDLDKSVDVHVRDPEMGRERHLWDTLGRALSPEHDKEQQR